MKIGSLFAVAVSLSLVAGSAVAEGSDSGKRAPEQNKAQKQGQSSTAAAAPVVLIVPLFTAMDEAMANGCWARLYDTTNFSGNMLTLSGPVDMPSLASGHIAGFEWDRNFDSVVVGPKATLMVFRSENYRDASTTFRPGQQVRDLDTRMGFFNDIDSLKVSCITP